MTTTIIMTTEKMEEAIKLIKSYQAAEQEIRELREAKEEEIKKIGNKGSCGENSLIQPNICTTIKTLKCRKNLSEDVLIK